MTIQSSWTVQPVSKELNLAADELHIWRAKVSENIDNLAHYRCLLSQDEQEKASLFHFVEDKYRYIIARGILKTLIGEYINSAARSIPLRYSEYGKPYLNINNISKVLKFNLSHANDVIIYGFTKNIDVGVDIEFVNDKLNIYELAPYFCTQEEYEVMLKLPEKQKSAYFYKLWVLKEAFIKSIGLGLSYDLKDISIDTHKNKCLIFPQESYMINYQDNKINICDFSCFNQYNSAFAVGEPIKKVYYLSYSMAALK